MTPELCAAMGLRGEKSAAPSAAVMRKPAAPTAQPDATHPAVAKAISAGGAEPLPAAVMAKMNTRLGHDFSRVRIRRDDLAHEAASALAAKAFTVGDDVFFAAGEYDPENERGERLLVHELSHVAQGARGQVPSASGGAQVVAPDDALEHEADAAAIGAPRASVSPAPGETPAAPGAAPRGAVMRAPAPPEGATLNRAHLDVTGRSLIDSIRT